MFFQNLSTATERKVTSAKKSKKTKSDDDCVADSIDATVKVSIDSSSPDETLTEICTNDILDSVDEIKPLESSEAVELKYTAETESVPRDVMLSFLDSCGRDLLNKSHLRRLVEENLKNKSKTLNEMLTEYQRDVLQNRFGVEKNFGCQYLSMMPHKFPDDTELLNAAKRFMFICMRSFVDALKLRHEICPDKRTERKMTKSEILEFFEACNALMAMPETKKILKQTYESTKTPPGDKVIELQREMLEILGIEKDFGVSCLNHIPKDFPDDPNIMQKMQQFAMCANVVTREACMSDEERRQFYADIPIFMQHVPHMFVIGQQQQMMRMQQMQMQQQMGYNQHGHNHNHNHNHNHAHEHKHDHPTHPPAEMQRAHAEAVKAMQEMSSSPENEARMQNLSMRLQSAKQRMLTEVKSWDITRRKDYLSEVMGGSLMQELNTNTDPTLRLQRFFSMSESELETLMSLTAIIELDVKQGSMAMKRPESGGIWGALSSLGSLAGFSRTAPPSEGFATGSGSGSGHDHSHGHSHSHGGHGGHHCPVHGVPTPGNDVTLGKGDIMDR